jgi:prepilin-type N-terminal cleavage/methylation domain-containing protein
MPVFNPGKKGFTLIELLISVAILAIISSIGFVTYTNAQISARDGKRKQDLRSIATALELYYQTNKRYPCTGNNVWINSSAGGDWISDLEGDSAAPNGCGDSEKPLNSNYINIMPKDPLNTGGNNPPWSTSTTYTYGYRGYINTGSCSTKNGQFYLLVAQLENKNDPERQAIRRVKDCYDGSSTSLTSTTWDTTYVLSSE